MEFVPKSKGQLSPFLVLQLSVEVGTDRTLAIPCRSYVPGAVTLHLPYLYSMLPLRAAFVHTLDLDTEAHPIPNATFVLL